MQGFHESHTPACTVQLLVPSTPSWEVEYKAWQQELDLKKGELKEYPKLVSPLAHNALVVPWQHAEPIYCCCRYPIPCKTDRVCMPLAEQARAGCSCRSCEAGRDSPADGEAPSCMEMSSQLC
jgi:hypothetical protein